MGTRNNNPRGLKFCRRPYQAKLTTIQHNFNPTIFLGGGVIYPPPWVNPTCFFIKKQISHSNLLDQKFFETIFFYPNFFWPRNFYPKFFYPKKFLTQKFTFTQKNFLTPKFFLTQKF